MIEARKVLAFERVAPIDRRQRAAAIRREFGCSEVIYARNLIEVLDDPRAAYHDPHTWLRLQRQREARRAWRPAPPAPTPAPTGSQLPLPWGRA